MDPQKPHPNRFLENNESGAGGKMYRASLSIALVPHDHLRDLDVRTCSAQNVQGSPKRGGAGIPTFFVFEGGGGGTH